MHHFLLHFQQQPRSKKKAEPPLFFRAEKQKNRKTIHNYGERCRSGSDFRPWCRSGSSMLEKTPKRFVQHKMRSVPFRASIFSINSHRVVVFRFSCCCSALLSSSSSEAGNFCSSSWYVVVRRGTSSWYVVVVVVVGSYK